ncbi:hypothetical protein NKDENANG_00863 [Candidatus Entotheonellaceae bacterium PAL068K]
MAKKPDVLLFGVPCSAAQFVAQLSSRPPGRWIYGLTGVFLAQMLTFLVLIDVVEGVSPSMEEAAQTLQHSRWKTFTTACAHAARTRQRTGLLGFTDSKASLEATHWGWAAIMMCCQPRSFSPLLVPRTTRGSLWRATWCWCSCSAPLSCSSKGLARSPIPRPAARAMPGCTSSARAAPPGGLRLGPALGGADPGEMRYDPVRWFRRLLGPRSQLDALPRHRCLCGRIQ